MISIMVYLGKCQEGYCRVKTEHTHRRNAYRQATNQIYWKTVTNATISILDVPGETDCGTDVFKEIAGNVSGVLYCICK